MPKLTGPLQSMYARGTLGHSLTYRGSTRGTTATRKPRHPVPIPSALRANAAVVRYLQIFIDEWDLPSRPTWIPYAKRLHLPPRVAMLKRNLNLWQHEDAFTYDPEYETAIDTPTPPTIGVAIRPGSSTPVITQCEPYDYYYLSVHRSTDPDEPPNRSNVIALLDQFGGPTEHEDLHDLHGVLYYRAIAWIIESGHTPTADAVSVTLP